MSDTTQLLAMFKNEYDTGSQVFEEQQNLNAPSFKKFNVSPIKPNAAGIFMPVTMAGNEAGGAITENQAFQNPGSPNPVQPQILSRLNVWPFTLTGSLMELSETDKQSFGTGLDYVMEDANRRMFSSLNRQSLGKGTGQVTLANGAGVGATSLIVDNIIPFRRNMRIDSYVTLAGAKEINGATITAVNYQTNTLTITPAQTWSDNSIIVMYDVNVGAPPGGKELTGVQAMCDTTAFSSSYEGVSVSANPEWVGNVVDAGNAPISQDLLQQVHNTIRTIGGGKPNWLISNYGQQRNFTDTELQKTRYEPTKVEAGYTVLKWGDLEWLSDKDYDIGEVGMYDTNFVEKFQTRDPHIASLTGNNTYQIVGYDQIGGYYRYQGNLGSWKRNAHGRLTGLIEPSLF